MKTRRDIGDRRGERSVYVIEMLDNGVYVPCNSAWITRDMAVDDKKDWERTNPRDKFRIALYERAE
jgi:hypothetical protein